MHTPKNIPQHVAIIMDGNGRWAKGRGLPKLAGHVAGAKTVEEITGAAQRIGVKVLTLYAFSTENWKRPKEEVGGLFKLLEERVDITLPKLQKNNIRLSVIGDIEKLPESTRNAVRKAIEATSRNTGMILVVALNYGGRQEIVEAVRRIAEDVRSGKLGIENIDEETFSDFLYTKGLPDPDLLIRTSGEMRISNFLLWQLSYAEIYVTKKMWPDFKKMDFEKAIAEYQRRQRRFGG